MSPRTGVYHACSYLSLEEELRAISRSLAGKARLPSDEPSLARPGDLDAFFELLEHSATDEPLVVVIDEVPYLIQGTERFPAALQRFWDRLLTSGATNHLMIVLTMVALVLLQKSEGGGLGMGGGGGNFLSSRGSANVLTRATAILAALFFTTSLILSILAGFSRNPHSLLDSAGRPVSGAPAEPGAPTSTGPGSLIDQLRGGGAQPAPAAPAAPSGPQVPRSQ